MRYALGCLLVLLGTTPAWAQLGTQLPPPTDWQQRRQRQALPLPQPQRLPVPSPAPIGQGSPLPPAPRAEVQPEQAYRVLVIGVHPVRLPVLRQLAPQALPVQYQGQVAMQVGVFSSLSEAEQLALQLRQQGLPAQVVGLVNPQRDARAEIVLQPQSQGSDLERMATWQQLRQNTLSSQRPTVRVLVRPATPTQLEEVMKLIPEAFRTLYRGQVLWQVGRFQDRSRAEQLVQYLRSRGFQVVVESQ